MTRRSKAERKKVPRVPRPGPPAHMVDMRWDVPQTFEVGDVRPQRCATGGRFSQCDCLVCVRRREGR